MPVLTEFNEQDFRLQYHLSCKNLSSTAALARTLADYREALQLIDRKLQDREIWFFSISIHAKKSLLAGLIPFPRRHAADRALRLIAAGQESAGEYNPWCAVCPDFWLAAASVPELQPEISALLRDVEALLKRANESNVRVTSLSENEQTAFAEPLISLLALHARSYVPDYTRFLTHWDLDHEVMQSEVISLIVATHGVGPETEDLLFCRVAINPGQNGYDQIEELFPLLQNAYGDFTRSSLFERILADVHAKDLAMKKAAFADYLNRKRSNPQAGQPKFAERNLFSYSENDALKSGAERVFQQLDKQFPPPDFAAV